MNAADAAVRKAIKGMECLVSMEEAIDILGLRGRKNPDGSLRWLIRMKRIRPVQHARGVYAFTVSELKRYIDSVTG